MEKNQTSVYFWVQIKNETKGIGSFFNFDFTESLAPSNTCFAENCSVNDNAQYQQENVSPVSILFMPTAGESRNQHVRVTEKCVDDSQIILDAAHSNQAEWPC